MAKFRVIRTLQNLTAVHASIQNHFDQDRHLNRGNPFKQKRPAAPAGVAAAGGVRSLASGRFGDLRIRLTAPPVSSLETFFFGALRKVGTARNAGICGPSSEPRAPADRPILGRFPSLSAPFL